MEYLLFGISALLCISYSVLNFALNHYEEKVTRFNTQYGYYALMTGRYVFMFTTSVFISTMTGIAFEQQPLALALLVVVNVVCGKALMSMKLNEWIKVLIGFATFVLVRGLVYSIEWMPAIDASLFLGGFIIVNVFTVLWQLTVFHTVRKGNVNDKSRWVEPVSIDFIQISILMAARQSVFIPEALLLKILAHIYFSWSLNKRFSRSD